MTKKEKAIYKSGRKNENAYHFSRLRKNQKKLLAYIIVISIIISVFFVLDKSDIAPISEIKNTFGAIEGVKPVESDFAVYYLDAGQSDCTVVVCDDKVMMIDTGTFNQLNTIRQSLHTLEIDTIDYMVITHQHDDHMGSATEIINDYDVKNFIMPRLAQSNNVTSKTYNVLINTINSKNINKIPAQDCKGFMLGAALVEILSPIEQSNNLNNMSIVLKITYGDTEFLFQGDAESKIENDLIYSDYDIDADVLKVGHHGSKTSTNEKFLDAVSPKVAIVSSGAENSYGHPNGTILHRLENDDIPVFITSFDGNIAVTSDGEALTVFTQNGYDTFTYK